MKQEVLYKYLGTNGVIISPVHLEDIYYVRVVRLIANPNKKITRDGINFYNVKVVPEDEINQWYEVDNDGQE